MDRREGTVDGQRAILWRDGRRADLQQAEGVFCSLRPCEVREMRGTGKWEARYEQAGMEVADCVGVEPGMGLASPSVSSYLGQPDSHVTDAKTHTHTHIRTHKCTHTYKRHAHFSISIYCVLLALPGSESSQTEGCTTHCQSV